MDLISLHSLMTKKKYYYFSGSTNSSSDSIHIDFSTGHNGRGDWFEFRIGIIDNDIYFNDINNNRIEHKNISDSNLIKYIEKR